MNEVNVEVGDKSTEIKRVVQRVKTLIATRYGTIKQESKLREKVKGLQTQIWKRMTEIQIPILEIIEEDPRDEKAISKARVLNNAIVELQSLSLDETAVTLILRKDMLDEELKRDREIRAERQ